jgi:outer membrane lipoprotein-sorting protein
LIRRARLASTLALLLLAAGARAPAAKEAPAPKPAPQPAAAAAGDSAALTGRDIYDRVLRNRFDSFSQETQLISGDRGGREQESRLQLIWQSFRDREGRPTRGVVSKTLVKYVYPFDVRFSGYLVIANHERSNDQFVYYPSRRKVVRVNLRSEAVFGTDFSYEDVIPREIEESEYERVADETVSGIPVYVIEVVPKPFAASEYSRVRVYVEQERFVPLRTRYWDQAGVEVKELRAVPSEIRNFDGVWLPMKVTMRNLLLDSYTTLVVSNFVPNPDLPDATFDLSRLESH